MSRVGMEVDSYHREAPNGMVTVYAEPVWLKSDTLISADLTPRQARKFAIKLLQDADRVEEQEGGDHAPRPEGVR